MSHHRTMDETTPRSGRLYERVAVDIRAAIAGGRYAVGDRLPSERDLAQHYKVSRPTVREAIIALELDGMVEVRTNSGVYVAALAPPGGAPRETDVGGFELLEARRLIESQIAALAAVRINDAEIAQLKLLLAEMEGSDLDTAEAADRGFHLGIARATANSALEMTVATLWDLRTHSPQYKLLNDKVRAAGVAPREPEHQRILEALAAHDPEEARKAMWDHLSRVVEVLLEVTETEAIERAKAEVDEKRQRVRNPLAGAVNPPSR